jgi:hypothetical protein
LIRPIKVACNRIHEIAELGDRRRVADKARRVAFPRNEDMRRVDTLNLVPATRGAVSDRLRM